MLRRLCLILCFRGEGAIAEGIEILAEGEGGEGRGDDLSVGRHHVEETGFDVLFKRGRGDSLRNRNMSRKRRRRR